MKNKKMKLIINLILIFIFSLTIFSTNVQADDIGRLDDWINQAHDFVQPNENVNPPVDMNQVQGAVIPIAQALVAIASIILVGVTVFMGIKYVTCQSADQKAKLKTQLIGLGISAAVIFGAQIIWATIYNIMKDVTQ